MASKIEIEVAKVYGIICYNCTAYDHNGKIISFMKYLLLIDVKRFVETFKMGNEGCIVTYKKSC